MKYAQRVLALTIAILLLTTLVLVLFAEFGLRAELVRVVAADQATSLVRQAQGRVVIGVLVVALPALILAWVVGRAIDRPLAWATQSVRNIAEGRAPQFPHSELAEADSLVSALRAMHEQMDGRFQGLQRRQAEAEALVNAMMEGVIACDKAGHVTIANPAARRLMGYEVGSSLPDLPVLFRQKPAREAVAAAIRGEAVPDREVELDDRTCLLSARGLPGGGAVVVLHDLTTVRRLETMRRDLVTNVSHELKTPLTSIAGYAETLLGDTPEPAVARQFLETILQNARRMQELVDDQLDLARIESGHWRPVPQAVQSEPLLREAWQPFEVSSRGSLRFVARVQPGAEVFEADPAALRQILSNLYDNARRHTPPGGTITAEIAPDKNGIVLSVRDTGTGIGSEHLPRIFERFYRADPSRSRAGGGSGLGLSIVKHLVEAHGGKAWASSTLGEGTTIACWFPHDNPIRG